MFTWIRNVLSEPKAAFFNWLSLGSQPCLAFGGMADYGYNEEGQACVGIRVCSKNRWHIDSHMYEIEYHNMIGKAE